MQTEKSIYFPGVNGLRFIAALAVIISHIELLKEMYFLPNSWNNLMIFNLGSFGVYFFFVLSGFLITYLLLAEKEKKGFIDIKLFYMRRILRIWPLYYFIMLLGFFVIPNIHVPLYYSDIIFSFKANFVLYLFILPNLALSLFQTVPHIGQAWSIGVEEQFYALWPWIISRSKNVFKTLCFISSGLIVFKVLVLLLGMFYSGSNWFPAFQKFIAMSKFECMAIGGIGAWLLFSKHRLVKILLKKYVMNLSLILIPIIIFITPEKLQNGIHIIYSVMFIVIILNVSQSRTWFSLEHAVLNYLGKISYGIYMYHFMLIPFVLFVVNYFMGSTAGFVSNAIIYLGSLLLSVAVSAFSFEFFENRFIKLKSKFSVIRSGQKN